MKITKKTLTFFLTVMMCCSLSACQESKSTEKDPSDLSVSGGYTPGTYEASATGMNGLVNVSVTFNETSIIEIVIKENAETVSISKPALTRLPQDIVEYQTLNVDTASGATISSYAVINAVADAVSQAGGDVEALKAAPKPNKEVQEDTTLTTDIVVVGSGLAGVSAALEAANLGKNVILIEKMESYGGSSAQSGGAICYTSEDFTANDYAEWLIEMGHGRENINEELIYNIADLAEDSLKFVRNAGVVIDYPVRETLQGGQKVSYLVSTKKSVVLGAGGLIIDPLIQKLSNMKNVTLMNLTAGKSLITNESGTVVGINAVRSDGSKVTIHADAVILATGGWDRNEDYTAKFAPGYASSVHLTGTGNTGDGITMTEAIGAMINYDVPMSVDGFAGLPVATTGDFILVNADGVRFVDESAPNIHIFNAIAQQENGIHYYIYDANELYEFVNVADRSALEAGAAAGTVIEAETIEELAEKIGIDSIALKETIARYNSFAGSIDTDFGKDTSHVTPYENGPFYAMSGLAYIMTSYGGPKVNADCQVLSTEGNPIKGLYAVGELAASNWTGYDTIGHGMSLQDGMSTGRIAAKHASENIGD